MMQSWPSSPTLGARSAPVHQTQFSSRSAKVQSSKMNVTQTLGSDFTKKEVIRCMLCGGQQCKRCGTTAYTAMVDPPPAIDKLHSSWITDSILAMQRPNNTLLIDHEVLNRFVDNNITAVFNLCEPGEHPYCGCGNISSIGFSYNPELLMKAKIKHFNFSWPDMTTPSMELMLNIVNIACNEISVGGKIAVHCHAGFGRTGVAIAAILIAKDQMESGQVVQFIRTRRPGSIQTSNQENFVHRFSKSYAHLMHSFPLYMDQLDCSVPRNKVSAVSNFMKSISKSVSDQHFLLNAAELQSSRFRWLSKVVIFTVKALKDLAAANFNLSSLAITGLTRLVPKSSELGGEESSGAVFDVSINTSAISESSDEALLQDIKVEINSNKWETLIAMTDIVSSSLGQKPSGSDGAPRADQRKIVPLNTNIDPFNAPGLGLETPPSTGKAFPLSPGSSASSEHSSPGRDMLYPIAPMLSEVSESHQDLRQRGKENETNIMDKQISTQSALLSSAGSDSFNFSNPNQSYKNFTDEWIGGKVGPCRSLFARTRSGSNFSTTHLRQSAMSKQSSPNDYIRTKQVSSNLVAQLLLDWLETRKDSLFDSDMVSFLQAQLLKFNMISPSEGLHDDAEPDGDRTDTSKLSSQPTMSVKSSVSPRQRWVLEGVESPTISDYSRAHTSMSIGKHHRHLSSDISYRNLKEPPLEEGPVLGGHNDSANMTQSHSRKHVQLAQQLAQAHQYQDLLSNTGEEDLDNQSSGDNSTSNSPMYCQPSNTGKFSSRFSSGVVAPDPVEPVLPRLNTGSGETNGNSLSPFTHAHTHTRSEDLSLFRLPPESSSKTSAQSSSVKIPAAVIKSRLAAVLTSELEERLDRFKMELLGAIVSLYKEIRESGKASNEGVIPPIDVLVGLRLSIAIIHATKDYPAIIRNRALNLDIVKVFLLKYTDMDKVTVNNITFSEANFETVKLKVGAHLFRNLEVVLRTLEILMDIDFPNSSMAARRVHWNSSLVDDEP